MSALTSSKRTRLTMTYSEKYMKVNDRELTFTGGQAGFSIQKRVFATALDKNHVSVLRFSAGRVPFIY